MRPRPPSLLAHLRAIGLLPVVVTLVIPYFIGHDLPAVLRAIVSQPQEAPLRPVFVSQAITYRRTAEGRRIQTVAAHRGRVLADTR